ncbi:hypothetical protein SLS55_001777 [Diplodia seriata]|uniref:Uncharacterized protein n=1 Tax=Diplodia seriata TaxID=420778 RepID=A0ABR3CQA7_9PEZI
MESYGRDHEKLSRYIDDIWTNGISVELVEVFKNNVTKQCRVNKAKFTEFDPLRTHICQKVPSNQVIRVVNITKLSGPLIQLLGSKYDMDYELWTSRFQSSDRECDPYINMDAAKFATDIPGDVQSPLASWITEFVDESSPSALLEYLSQDGFGFVLKVLREIKTTWKLLLNEMEVFLEELNEELNDDELMDSATWLHRQFILNIDYFQRQLMYQQRYVNYLVNAPSQEGLHIVPGVFKKDLLQESNALIVVDQRLKALRNWTSAILDTVVNLNAVKQARLAAEMTQLQHEDAALTFSQGQSIRLPIQDLRGIERNFSLGEHSFAALMGVPGEAIHFDDDEDVRSNYLPMIEDLMLSEVPGSQKVVVFDFTIRKASSTKVVNE